MADAGRPTIILPFADDQRADTIREKHFGGRGDPNHGVPKKKTKGR